MPSLAKDCTFRMPNPLNATGQLAVEIQTPLLASMIGPILRQIQSMLSSPDIYLQERARFEADALREEARLCPEHVPEVYHFDPQLCLIVMQYLPPPHDVVRHALTAGRIYPKLAQHLATFMARTLFGTSLFALDAKTWR